MIGASPGRLPPPREPPDRQWTWPPPCSGTTPSRPSASCPHRGAARRRTPSPAPTSSTSPPRARRLARGPQHLPEHRHRRVRRVGTPLQRAGRRAREHRRRLRLGRPAVRAQALLRGGGDRERDVGSSFRSSFGTDYGVTMVDGRMRGLLARVGGRGRHRRHGPPHRAGRRDRPGAGLRRRRRRPRLTPQQG